MVDKIYEESIQPETMFKKMLTELVNDLESIKDSYNENDLDGWELFYLFNRYNILLTFAEKTFNMEFPRVKVDKSIKHNSCYVYINGK